MAIIYHYICFILFFGLLVHSYLIHPPFSNNDEFMAVFESNDNANNRQSDSKYYPTSRSYNVLKFLEELINSYENDQASNNYFYSNLNLPRYLRHIN
ncbi:unnamed protein product [Rotaria sp. Silwood1]|nr:unnamed protein product [Rotaria sp. Silwood1]